MLITNLDSFVFVISFISFYFFLSVIAYFGEIGVDEINLWKFFVNLAIITLFFALLSLFLENNLYQSIPIMLILFTSTAYFVFNWFVGKEDILYKFGSIFSIIILIITITMKIFHMMGYFAGFEGGTWIGISVDNEGPTFNQIFDAIFTFKVFNEVNILLMATFIILSVITFINFIRHDYNSYIYLQGRPGSNLWLVYSLIYAVLFILNYMQFPQFLIFITYGVFISLNLFTTMTNYQRSRGHKFYYTTSIILGITAFGLILSLSFNLDYLYPALFIFFSFVSWLALYFLPDQDKL